MKKIFIANKKQKIDNIKKKYPFATILDITSTSEYGGLRILSPFYPHGNIPIPGMPGRTASCVEAVWQGLKVFESCGVDYSTFDNNSMKNLKRTVRKFGKPLGHQYGGTLLNYEDARWIIYLPTYLYVLENIPSVQNTLERIKDKLDECDIVFLDYNTNYNLIDYSKPLSHAGLVKLYLEGRYPTLSDKEQCCLSHQTSQDISINDIICAIKNHPDYKQEYELYVQQMLNFREVNWRDISDMNGHKRDGWKKLIKEVMKICISNMQLALF